jgi:hypothetical protein
LRRATFLQRDLAQEELFVSASEPPGAGDKSRRRLRDSLLLGFAFLLGRQFLEMPIDDLGCVLKFFLVRQKLPLHVSLFRVTQIVDIQTF